MCGIAGLLDPRGRYSYAEAEEVVGSMADRLAHRGPDGRGTWSDWDSGFAVGHRRLAVVDLSEAGRQPMVSSDGRWVLAYNGELYGADRMKAAFGLDDRHLRGHSDTEVLVEAIARAGVDRVLRRAVGMFAFAVWDRREKELWLARDRFGEKPLYVGHHDGMVLFGSELKALFAVSGFSPTIDLDAVADLIRWSNVPAPFTVFEEVRKVRPGHVLRMDRDGRVMTDEAYWSPTAASSGLVASAPRGDEAVEELDRLLVEVVGSRMVSDVPLGGFLSGGIDSSLIAATMARISDRPIQTFTIGFTEKAYDESSYARAVADHLGTEHQDLMVSPDDARAVIPDLAAMYDEPFADSSQIPTALLCRLARDQVTVALSGDGGDELFGGYERYRMLERFGTVQKLVPGPIRRVAGRVLGSVSADRWEDWGGRASGRLGKDRNLRRLGHRVHKAARVLEADDLESAYRSMMSSINDVSHLVPGAVGRTGEMVGALTSDASRSGFEQAMLMDTGTYLPDDLLVKVDRASMAVGLEVRVPFLDPGIFDFAWGLNHGDRYRDGRGKWILRRLLDRHVPAELVDRPKMGFGVPVGPWLRGPLRDWADDLLSPASVAAQGYLDSSAVTDVWTTHRGGEDDLVFQLWPLLMFQAWLEEGWV